MRMRFYKNISNISSNFFSRKKKSVFNHYIAYNNLLFGWICFLIRFPTTAAKTSRPMPAFAPAIVLAAAAAADDSITLLSMLNKWPFVATDYIEKQYKLISNTQVAI